MIRLARKKTKAATTTSPSRTTASSHSQNEASIDQQRACPRMGGCACWTKIVRGTRTRPYRGRPSGFQLMLSEVARNPSNTLIAWKTDRLEFAISTILSDGEDDSRRGAEYICWREHFRRIPRRDTSRADGVPGELQPEPVRAYPARDGLQRRARGLQWP